MSLLGFVFAHGLGDNEFGKREMCCNLERVLNDWIMLGSDAIQVLCTRRLASVLI